MYLISSLQGRELERGVGSNKADLEAKSVSEAAKQLGSEAAKFFNVREFVKILSLLTKLKLSTLAP